MAIAAVTASTRPTDAYVIGSSGSTPKRNVEIVRESAAAAASPTIAADDDDSSGAAEHQPQHVGRRCAERDADAELARSAARRNTPARRRCRPSPASRRGSRTVPTITARNRCGAVVRFARSVSVRSRLTGTSRRSLRSPRGWVRASALARSRQTPGRPGGVGPRNTAPAARRAAAGRFGLVRAVLQLPCDADDLSSRAAAAFVNAGGRDAHANRDPVHRGGAGRTPR